MQHKPIISLFIVAILPAFAQLPNPKLTPGAVRTTDAKAICAAKFTTRDERHTTAAMKLRICGRNSLIIPTLPASTKKTS